MSDSLGVGPDPDNSAWLPLARLDKGTGEMVCVGEVCM